MIYDSSKYDNGEYESFIATLSISITSGDVENAGIIFRAQNVSATVTGGGLYYAYSIYAATDVISLGIMNNGWNWISQTSAYTVNYDTIYTLKIIANGTLYDFYFDGILVWANVTLDTLTDGTFGLRTYLQNTKFHYLSVEPTGTSIDMTTNYPDSTTTTTEPVTTTTTTTTTATATTATSTSTGAGTSTTATFTTDENMNATKAKNATNSHSTTTIEPTIPTKTTLRYNTS